ncbi:unnamed protein product [Laminaria digitata]
MPLSIWGDDDPSGDPGKAPERRQIPPLRAAGVTWKMPVDMLVSELSDSLTFGGPFDQPIADVAWPVSFLELTFLGSFDQPIDGCSWPASLKKLTFGHSFNQPITGTVWPASLLQLTLGSSFCFSIGFVVLAGNSSVTCVRE